MTAGCGEKDSTSAVRAVDDFVSALIRADGRMACDQLSEAGISELLLVAVQAQARPTGSSDPRTDHCASIASVLASDASGLDALRDSPVTGTTLHGDRAIVRTRAGSYEAEEIRGRWVLSRFEPVARVLTGGAADERPVDLTVIRPKLSEPALGAALAGRVRGGSVELTGTIEPARARLSVDTGEGARATRVQVADGRFRIELELSPGANEVHLSGQAPERAAADVPVRLHTE